MKSIYNKSLMIFSLLLLVGVLCFPEFTNAQGTTLVTKFASSAINSLLADAANAILAITSAFVTVTGVFLSVSLSITTNIGTFFNNMPALKSVWIVVRNLSSMFIIFLLLYTSIQTILGTGKADLKNLVGKIIMAGLLINFSLFAVKIGIDASNIVSLQFYRAIAGPSSVQNFSVGQAFNDGESLSAVFMSSLKIPQIYQNTNVFKSSEVGLGILIAMSAGIIMMLAAGMSFLAAGIAFTARTGILLFVMALSPLYFASWIFPKLKSQVADKLMSYFTSQLIFMPVYLFLMYVALRIISDPGFMSIFNHNATGMPTAGESPFGITFIGILIQYTIAILFINAPLAVAISLGAVGAKWAPNATDMSKVVGKWTGRYSYGLGAAWIANNNSVKNAAAKNIIAAGALRGIRNIASDYNESARKSGEERAKFGESLGYDKQKVAVHEDKIRNIKRTTDVLNAIINDPSSTKAEVANAKAAKKRAEADIKDQETLIAEEKRSRQIAYATRIDPREIDSATGKLKSMSLMQRVRKAGMGGIVHRSEQIASSQLHIKNTESDIEQLKKKLDEKKDDIKTIKADIKRIDEQDRQGRVAVGDKQDLKRTELKKELSDITNDHINPLQEDIRNKEIEVRRYKDLS